MARKTTNKTGGRKQGPAPRRSRTTQAADETTPSDAAKTPDRGDTADSTQSAESPAQAADGPTEPSAAQAAPLTDGPAQMGDDTATAPDVPTPEAGASPTSTPGPDATDLSAPDDDAPRREPEDAVSSHEADAPVREDTVAAQAPEPEASQTDAPGSDPVAAAAEPADATSGTTSAEPAAPAQPDTQPTPPPAPKRASVFPMLLGGLVAGGIGYGAHLYQTSQEPALGADLTALQADMAAQRAELAALQDRVDQGPDLSGLRDRVAALESADMPDLGAVEAAIDDLRAQIAAVPEPTDTSDLQAQIAALQAEEPVDLAPLRTRIAALESAYDPVPEQVAALQAEMQDLRALATEEVAAAEAAVDTAMARAGLDRIRAALVTGAPFADAVDQLAQAGIAVPDVLRNAAMDGVRPVEALQDSYADAARAAVSASLQSAPADSTTEKLGNFFRAQIGARSLAPREGNAPDAVTARAGAAVAEGDLARARDELASLPDAGRTAMAAWLGAVETRLNAAAALDAVQAEITTE